MRRALIVTTLPVEYRAVRARPLRWSSDFDEHGTPYDRGVLKTPLGDWEIILTRCDRYNAPSGVATERALRFCRPQVALFVGVAGGLKDVRLGDVVAAPAVFAYEAGKAKRHFQPRVLARESSFLLVELAKVVAESSDWLGSTAIFPEGVSPEVLVEPIASGEKVVADRQGDVYTLLRSSYENALAVETEGFGFLTAARGHRGVEAMVVRGISDLVQDKTKADAEGWQERASQNAAAFAFALLERFQRPSSGKRRRTGPVDVRLMGVFQERTQQLLSWPQVLPGDQWIERPELQQLLGRIEDTSGSRTVLVGRPGSGKSALLARLGSSLAQRDDVVLLALRADHLPTHVGSQSALQKWLRLRAPLAEVLKRLCQSRTVVLLLDQLDALAEFVDLHTRRLDVLMELLQDLGETDNLHIVASCRSFDYQHDVRLTRYPAEKLEFELPEWSKVETVLRGAGMNPSGWPTKFREVLRTPQHLKIFLQHFSKSGKPFASYQQMLEDLWQTHVLVTRGLGELVVKLAARMTDQEELSLPLARFDKDRKRLQLLEARGILKPEGLRISFTHQTLLEFARARAFVSGRERLDRFVLARQSTLTIRPKLLGSLEYLRATGGTTYRREFERLWYSRKLRPHVRALMLDFLGQLDDPSDEELSWLLESLKDSAWYQHALRVVAGSSGWFARLAPRQLQSFMSGPEEQARAVLPVLVQGWRIGREQVLELIEKSWVPRTDRHELALTVLRWIDGWDERAVDAVTAILRRSPTYSYFASHLASLVSAQLPTLAPGVIAGWLESQVRQLLSSGREGTELKHAYEGVLIASEWHEAPEIAAAAPIEFLRALWPFFVDVLQRFVEAPHAYVTGYPRSHLLLLDPEEAPLVRALEDAVNGMAKQAPLEFLKFVDQWSRCEVLQVHRWLSRGLRHVAETYPKAVLAYLLADSRRMILGDFPDEHEDSGALIQALVPRLVTDDRRSLEDAIKGWNYYFGNVLPARRSDPLSRLKNEREHRLRLLMAIPAEWRSADTQRLIREEERALGTPEPRTARSWTLLPVESPMSAEQMGKARIEDIVGFFEELTDDMERGHPRRRRALVGGSVEAARAFADFAAKEPRKAIEYMRRFTPGKQEWPVAYALSKLSRAGCEPTELSQWVVEFDSRGFRSEMFREAGADVLEQVAQPPEGLADKQQRLLASWLKDVEPAALTDSEESFVRGSSQESRPQPVLGGLGVWEAVPHGNYPILRAMLRGYLAREPAAIDQAFSLLEAHLKRREQPQVWQMLCHHLIPLLHEVGPERASAFMWNLLSQQRMVPGSRAGVYLLNAARWWSSPKALQVWVWLVRSAGWKEGAQAFGELVVRVALINGHAWAKHRLENILSGYDPKGSELPSLRLGVAFASSQLFKEPEFREGAVDLLSRLMPGADDSVAMAIMRTLNARDELMDDPGTVRLLEKLLEYPEILRGGVHRFVEALGALVTMKPALVVKLCHAVLDQLPLHSGMHASRSTLVDLALTLERQQRSRSQGLLLFERMLRESSIAHDAEEALRQSDGRRVRETPDVSRR